MRNSLVVAIAALSLLTPIPSSGLAVEPPALRVGDIAQPALILAAKGRGRGERLRGAENSAGRGEARGRPADPGPRVYRPPPESWGRGQYLPGPYRGGQIRNPNQLRLRQPPAGYDWVRVGRDIYLTQRATGLVVEAIPGGF